MWPWQQKAALTSTTTVASATPSTTTMQSGNTGIPTHLTLQACHKLPATGIHPNPAQVLGNLNVLEHYPANQYQGGGGSQFKMTLSG